MTDKERREDDALKNLIQAAYDYSDDELLADLEEVEATLSDSDFPGIEDRMYRKMMAQLAEEEATEQIFEKSEDNSADKAEEELENAEVPKCSEIITEIPPIAATAETGEKVVRFGKKKVVVVGILAAAFVGMLGVTAIGGKSYFFRDREKNQSIVTNNDNNLKSYGALDEVYKEIEQLLDIRILKLGYLPKGYVFNELEIIDNQAMIVFQNEDKVIYFIQEQLTNEASIGVSSDREKSGEVVYNEWISHDLILEEEVLENNEFGYAVILNIDNARYRIVGKVRKEEMIEMAKFLNFL